VELEPGSVGRGRAKVLTVGETVLHRFQRGVAERARHVAIEGADDGFGIVAQQIGGRVLVIDGLVGDAPASEEKIVLVVLKKPVAEIASRRYRFQAQQVHRSSVDIGGIPVFEPSLKGRGLAWYEGNPGVIAQLNDR